MFQDMSNTVYTEEACRQSAEHAQLRYVRDTEPGIQRKRAGKGFRYFSPSGERITSEKVLNRIHALAIPPAYTQVWICSDERGHLQATGRDTRRRKQYRYHPKWEQVRAETKFHQMREFAEALPAIRARTDEDIARRELSRERVLATVVQLMDQCLIRVGNAQYAAENQTYGITTLRKKHVDVEGRCVTFEFTGKSGKPWNLSLCDRRIASTIRKCEEIPGYELFKYIDAEGVKRSVTSEDVNAYIREVTGRPFTAKDFRTHAATRMAIAHFSALPASENAREQGRRINKAIREIASTLGHTPAVCRECYIHPRVFEVQMEGKLGEWYANLSDEQRLNLVRYFLQ